MKWLHPLSISMLVAAAIAALPGAALGQTEEHKLTTPQDITWGPAPTSLPPGAQAAVLYGDPGKDGQFAFRLKMPKDYYIAPHSHPKPEIVTVLTGTARLGMGPTADRAKATMLPAGSFFALPPDSPHYFFADEDTVIQLNSIGPWGIIYVSSNDDPRQTTGAAPSKGNRPAR